MSTVAERIPLQALSARQRRRVEENLPLIQLTIDRMKSDPSSNCSCHDRRDLIQQGTLALAEAVRRHDPTLHGDFASYAMARVHQSLGRYVHEDETLIRVPYISQRRRRSARSHDPRNSPRSDDESGSRERHRPDPIPRMTSHGNLSSHQFRSRHGQAGRAYLIDTRPTLGLALRHRIDRARRRTLDRMMQDAGANHVERRVIARCNTERWAVPDAHLQASFRSLAESLACAATRLFRYERRFRESIAADLASDRVFNRLVILSRIRRDAWRHILDTDDYAYLRHGEAANIDLQP